MTLKSAANIRKSILLILLIILLLGGGVLLIDFVSAMAGLYLPIPGLSYIKSFVIDKKIKMAENPYLLEREELAKEKERLALLDEQITIKSKELESLDLDSNKKLDLIKEKENDLAKREKLLEDKQNLFNDKEKNIKEQASKLINMPPKDAVALLEQQTEADIVDIIRAIDSYFLQAGLNSTSPFLLKLMQDINKEKAGNVLRKLKYSTGTETTAVQTLENTEIPPNP